MRSSETLGPCEGHGISRAVKGAVCGTTQADAADVGAWLFTCNPREFAELEPGLRRGGSADGWCVHPTYRVDLVAADQPAVLWISASATSVPEPGIWMVGRTTGVVERDLARPRVELEIIVPSCGGAA